MNGQGESAVKSGTYTRSKKRRGFSRAVPRRHRDVDPGQARDRRSKMLKPRGTHHVHRRTEQCDRNHRGKQRRVKVCMTTPRFGRGGAVCTPVWDTGAEGPLKRHFCDLDVGNKDP